MEINRWRFTRCKQIASHDKQGDPIPGDGSAILLDQDEAEWAQRK